jgi:hypothetical protein
VLGLITAVSICRNEPELNAAPLQATHQLESGESVMPTKTKFLIVQLLTGEKDIPIRNGSLNLRDLLLSKENVGIDTPDDTPGLLTALVGDDIGNPGWFDKTCKEVGESGIVYLRGHGNWRASTLGGRRAETIARMLHKLPEGATVNVLGCNTAVGARDGYTDDSLGEVSFRSFSGELHRLLKTKRTTVIARSQPVEVGPNGHKVTYGSRNLELDPQDKLANMKMMLDKVSKRKDSKWQFYWDGEDQKYKPVY